jgi:hypothetical protein
MDLVQHEHRADGTMKRLPSVARLSLWALAILLGCIVANVLALRAYGTNGYALDVGARYAPEEQFLLGFYEPERDDNDLTYRWSQGHSTFRLRGFVPAPDPVLQLVVGGVPATATLPLNVEVEVDGAPAAVLPLAAAQRSYAIQLPTGALADGDLDVTFRNAVAQGAGDDRPVGFRLDALAVRWGTARWLVPLPAAIGAQWAAICVWLGMMWRLEMRRAALVPLACALVVILAWMAGRHQFVAMAWTMRLLGTGALLLALAWNALALLRRYATGWAGSGVLRWVCILTAASVAIRLFGVYYPFWESHDLYIHRDRLSLLQLGSLHLYDRPSEFGGRRTIVPPAYYLMASPLTLVAAHPGVPLQGIYAVFDGFNPLLTALFAGRLGARPRAALVAAIMVAVLPIQWTALWWGFGPQVAAQTLVLVLALLITRPDAPTMYTYGFGVFVLSLLFLMHPGVAVLTAITLGLYVALLWWFHRARRRWWLGWSAVVALTGVIVTVALYVDVIALQLSGVSQGSAARPDFTEWDRIRLTLEGMGASLRPVGFPLMVLGAVVLLRGVPRPHLWFIVAWLLSAAVFFAVDLATALQVRYAYFAIAPLCVGLGVLLDGLMQRGRIGALLAWSFAGFVAVYGLALWIDGVFFDIKPTLTALLH